jgi:GTP cyclohydrolase I
MKLKGIVLNIKENKIETRMNKKMNNTKDIDGIDDEHWFSSDETPLKKDAFILSDEEKIKKISHHFAQIMDTLGLDLKDDSLKGTPLRVAKMYVNEVFSGLDPKNKPVVKLFENTFKYNEMLTVRNIELYSYCEHHFVPIVGKVHVAYFPENGKVVGLSKINRIVRHFSKRPQVQERLNQQIAKELCVALETNHVAVMIDAFHFCVASRGIEDTHSSTITSVYKGKFQEDQVKNEFLNYILADKKQ